MPRKVSCAIDQEMARALRGTDTAGTTGIAVITAKCKRGRKLCNAGSAAVGGRSNLVRVKHTTRALCELILPLAV